jgi:hypothetical protein
VVAATRAILEACGFDPSGKNLRLGTHQTDAALDPKRTLVLTGILKTAGSVRRGLC